MALFGGYGIDVELDITKDMIFSEMQSCACIEVSSDDLDSVNKMAIKYNLPYKIIGKVGQKGGNINIDSVSISHEEAKELYFNSFKYFMENQKI